jgi:Na+/serine symporter
MGWLAKYPPRIAYPLGFALGMAIIVITYSILYFAAFHRRHADLSLLVAIVVGVSANVLSFTRTGPN